MGFKVNSVGNAKVECVSPEGSIGNGLQGVENENCLKERALATVE